VIEREGDWNVLRVLYAGAVTGDLIRVNTETNEVSYPAFPPARWTMRSGGMR